MYQQRLQEIVAIVKPCRIQLVNSTNEEFKHSYREAVRMLNTYKEANPPQAANYKNTFRAKILQSSWSNLEKVGGVAIQQTR